MYFILKYAIFESRNTNTGSITLIYALSSSYNKEQCIWELQKHNKLKPIVIMTAIAMQVISRVGVNSKLMALCTTNKLVSHA